MYIQRALITATFLLLLFIYGIPEVSAFTVSKPATGNTLGLVGWWTFDGVNVIGGLIRDKSGLANHGTQAGTATSSAFAAGKIGQAMRFDGVDDHVDIADSTSMRVAESSGSFTLAFWLNAPRVQNSNNRTIGTENTIGSQQGWDVTLESGTRQISFILHDGTNQYTTGGFSPSAYVENQWTHITAVLGRNASLARLYVNGIQTDSDSVSGAGSFEKNIGLDFSVIEGASSRSLIGLLDDVRLYSRALSAGEIMVLYQQGGGKQGAPRKTLVDNGLVGYWTFDGPDIINGSIRDVSGRANHASTSGTATSSFYTAGKIGQAVNFDSVDDAIFASSATILDDISPLSFSYWAYARSLGEGSSGRHITKSTSGGQGWVFGYNSTGNSAIFFSSHTGTDLTVMCASGFERNVWNHWTVTWDGTTEADNVHVYKDGTEMTCGTRTDGTGTRDSDAAASLMIGNVLATNFTFDGMIDEVRLYNRILTAAEVDLLYNVGSSTVAVTPRSTGNLQRGLVAHWTFDGKDMAGGVARDITGNGLHGTVSGIATSTFYTVGRIGQGLRFDNVDDTISMGTPAALQLADQVTLSAWFYKTAGFDSSSDHIAGRLCYQLEAGASASDLEFRVTNAAAVPLTSTTGSGGLVNHTWYHAVGTYASSTGTTQLFLNGVLRDTDTSASQGAMSASCVSSTFAISKSSFFGGIIDDVRVYNRVLSNAEILQLYRLGAN